MAYSYIYIYILGVALGILIFYVAYSYGMLNRYLEIVFDITRISWSPGLKLIFKVRRI